MKNVPGTSQSGKSTWYFFSWCCCVAGWLLAGAAEALACPGCKESLFDPGGLPQRLALAKGYALSIGLMLAVPLGLVGGLTVLIIRSARSKRGSRPCG